MGYLFLSTLSLRRATALIRYLINTYHHFYPRSPCGERLRLRNILGLILHFYPRSPCGERPVLASILCTSKNISIHALLAESDYIMTTIICIASKFLSTLSLRRATDRQRKRHPHPLDFYPRSPCGERLAHLNYDIVAPNFYPRSPCGERQYCLHVAYTSL